jgi:RNA polymerase sigma-70 factor (ECF subfamily)
MSQNKAGIMDPDMKVVKRVLEGDVESYGVLVNLHKDKLFGVLMRILADPLLAEEVAQNTFVKAYTQLSGFRMESAFSTWLIQIGVHQARDFHRSRRRRMGAGIVSLDELRQDGRTGWEPADDRQISNPLSDMESQEKWAALESELKDIPAAFREVFTLRHLENMEYEDIARMTGDSAGTLKVRAHRARALLKTKMEARGFKLGSSAETDLVRPARRQEGS